MTTEGSSRIGFENERCHISTTSYSFTADKPTAARRDNSLAAKLLIFGVSLLIAFILIGFIARWVSSSPEETTDDEKQIVAAGLTGFVGLRKASPQTLNVSQLLKHAPTYESIMAQYEFNVNDTKKLILIWSDWSETQGYNYNRLIGKKFCNYTHDRNLINNSDAVVFRDVSNDDDLPDRTNPKQIWVFNDRKPNVFNFTKHKHSFNWTATHRFDSTVPHLYDYLWSFNNQSNISDSQLVEKYIQSKNNISQSDRVKVAVFVDCDNTELITDIIELRKYINLDCYCPRGLLNGHKAFDQPIYHVSKWFALYRKKYVFYFALEEKQCEYYITNQFFGALRNELIPIVRGNKAVYEKLAPHNSYIHIDSFKNMQDMAQHLDDLNKHSEKLAKYLRWKKTTTFSNVYWYTQLCNLLQGTNDEEIFMIDNINDKINMC